MKRTIVCLIGALLLISAQPVLSEDEIIRLEPTGFETLRRPAAVFDHDMHNEAAELEDDCSVCHHVYENNQRVEDESSEDSACAECHPVKPESARTTSLENAFHRQCKSCHFEVKKGPVMCGECHKKEAPADQVAKSQ
jgi:hypothetical protein